MKKQWIRPMICVAAIAVCAGAAWIANAQEQRKWLSLFDGKTLDGWVTADGKPVTGGWSVKDGCIHLPPNLPTRAGNIFTDREYSDFVLEFEWKIEKGGNNGVKYRVIKYEGGGLLGPEYQLIDDNGHADGTKGDRQTASVYALYAPDDNVKQVNPPGEFNKSRIVCAGSRIQHWLNGKKVVDADTSSKLWRERVAASKFAKYDKFGENRSGLIMLTDHKDAVWFRNIRIRELSIDRK